MRTFHVLAVLMVVFTPHRVSAQPSPPPDPNKVQVLILTGQNVHDWRGTTPLLKQALETTGRFEVRIIEEVRGIGPETLAPYDLLVVNYYNRSAQDRWGDRANAAVEEFVRNGKGAVIVAGHGAMLIQRVRLEGRGTNERESIVTPAFRRRFRDIRQGPDGLLYLVSSNIGNAANTGSVYRVEPAE